VTKASEGRHKARKQDFRIGMKSSPNCLNPGHPGVGCADEMVFLLVFDL
jgi:hypothetical protein